MKREVYERVYANLKNYEDVDRIAREEDLERTIVYVIYSQKTVRRATKRFYRIKRAARPLLKQWKSGVTLKELAHKEDFPPMLLSFILVQEMGHSKKAFWSFVKEERKAPCKRLEKELRETRIADRLYSPEANAEQDERGKMGEKRLASWLDHIGVEYHIEDELRKQGHVKTPDFLLKEPLKIDGFTYNWFESKAIFADDMEYRRHIRGQLVPYMELHGTGGVAYWLGYIDDLEPVEGVKLLGPEFFQGF